jgi:hypothetical protein
MADLRLTEKRIWTLLWMSLQKDDDGPYNIYDAIYTSFVDMGMIRTDAQEKRFRIALERVLGKVKVQSNLHARDPFQN